MKRVLALLITCLLCLVFAACTGKQPSVDSTAQPTAGALNTAGATEQAEGTEPVATVDPNYHYLTFEEVYDPETDCNNGLVQGYANVMRTQDAYYYAGPIPGFLYYNDRQTGEYDVLCSKPECMHDSYRENHDCSGYINASGTLINLYKDKIYFIAQDYEDGKIKRTESLYCMNLDSTGREKLFTFEEESRFVPMHTYMHRGRLYGMTWNSAVKDAAPICFWNVTSWDIKTGEYKVLFEEELGYWAEPSVFFFGKYVYVCVSYRESEWNTDTEEHGDISIRVFRYDIETEQSEMLLDVRDHDYPAGSYAIAVAAENKVYVAPQSNGEAISIYLVENGELNELFTVKASRVYLFADKIITSEFIKPDNGELRERRWHYTLMDYNGSVLEDETVGLETVFGLSENIIRIATLGVYSDEGAIFAGYVLSLDPEVSKDNTGMTCLVKYELVDGKLVETLIVVQKWA